MRPTNARGLSAANAATLLLSTGFAANSFASDEPKTRRTAANASKGKGFLEKTLKQGADAQQPARAIPSAISNRSAAATQP